jgi:hypothetical protein
MQLKIIRGNIRISQPDRHSSSSCVLCMTISIDNIRENNDIALHANEIRHAFYHLKQCSESEVMDQGPSGS